MAGGTCRTREMALALEGPPKMRLRDSVLESSGTPGSYSEEVRISKHDWELAEISGNTIDKHVAN